MLVVILLLLVQFTSLLDAAIVQQEQLHSVDDTPMRLQRQESTFQQCLDTGVPNLTEADSFCANKIEGFLTAARSQPENLTLPQDVIDGICQCYNSLSEIYYNCTGTLLSVIKSIYVVCGSSGESSDQNCRDYQLPQQLSDGICDINNVWDQCPPGCTVVLSNYVYQTGCCGGEALLIHAVNNVEEFKKTVNIYTACGGQLFPQPCPILQVENATAISGGESGDYIGQCLSNKVTDIAIRDVNCANKIAKFINISAHNYDYYYDYASYPGAYSDYITNAPQDTIDTLCMPNCRSELTRLYRRCISNDLPLLDVICTTTRDGQRCVEVFNEFIKLPRAQQMSANSTCAITTPGQCPPGCPEELDFTIEQLGCCYGEILNTTLSDNQYQAVINSFRVCGRSLPKPCSDNSGCNGWPWAVNGTLMITLLITAASLIIQ